MWAFTDAVRLRLRDYNTAIQSTNRRGETSQKWSYLLQSTVSACDTDRESCISAPNGSRRRRRSDNSVDVDDDDDDDDDDYNDNDNYAAWRGVDDLWLSLWKSDVSLWAETRFVPNKGGR